MADWINITDTQVDPDAPLTSQLAYAWRDNPIAIAEGAAGAPALLDAALDTTATTAGRDWVLKRTALAGAGAVGTYGYFRCANTASIAFGSTVAGSTLTPVGHRDPDKSIVYSGTAQSGTWRCMGHNSYAAVTGAGDPADYGVTLWLRIS